MSQNDLLHTVGVFLPFRNEQEALDFHAGVDEFFPVPAEEFPVPAEEEVKTDDPKTADAKGKTPAK